MLIIITTKSLSLLSRKSCNCFLIDRSLVHLPCVFRAGKGVRAYVCVCVCASTHVWNPTKFRLNSAKDAGKVTRVRARARPPRHSRKSAIVRSRKCWRRCKHVESFLGSGSWSQTIPIEPFASWTSIISPHAMTDVKTTSDSAILNSIKTKRAAWI